ncbi:MAG: hypothetical protein ABEJ27_04700 [Halodesulfurarchaeum sp.]
MKPQGEVHELMSRDALSLHARDTNVPPGAVQAPALPEEDQVP